MHKRRKEMRNTDKRTGKKRGGTDARERFRRQAEALALDALDRLGEQIRSGELPSTQTVSAARLLIEQAFGRAGTVKPDVKSEESIRLVQALLEKVGGKETDGEEDR